MSKLKNKESVLSLLDAIEVLPPSEEMRKILSYDGHDQEVMLTTEIARRNYVAKVLRGDWVADFNNPNQKKWYCWFIKTSAGWVFDYTFYERTDTYTAVGPRLCFPDEETAEHFGRNFTELHNAVLNHQ